MSVDPHLKFRPIRPCLYPAWNPKSKFIFLYPKIAPSDPSDDEDITDRASRRTQIIHPGVLKFCCWASIWLIDVLKDFFTEIRVYRFTKMLQIGSYPLVHGYKILTAPVPPRREEIRGGWLKKAREEVSKVSSARSANWLPRKPRWRPYVWFERLDGMF